MEKLKVGAVSYLNTKPLIYGLEKGMMIDKVTLTIDYPAKIASELINGQIDIGLIPVAAIPQLKEHYIVSDYGIGAIGAVASVCLFSEVPLEEIDEILLDYQSKTSVALLKILLKEYWKIAPRLTAATENFQENIKGSTAGLIIGDRALLQRKVSAYIFDLAEAWIALTSLPFLFAAWVSNKRVGEDFINEFNQTNLYGLQNISAVIAQNPFDAYPLSTYYHQNISYIVDKEKKKALELFLSKLV